MSYRFMYRKAGARRVPSALALGGLCVAIGSCASGGSGSRRSQNENDPNAASGPARAPSDGDSDGDYLTNGEEARLGTDPNVIDSDGDGYSDFVEVRGFESDPNDPNDALPDGDLFAELPYQGDPQTRTITLTPRIEAADVNLLLDTTVSMLGARTNIIRGLVDTIIPGIQAEIPSVHLSVAGYADYPVDGHGSVNDAYSDLPYFLLRKTAPIEEDKGAWSLDGNATTCPQDLANHHIGSIVGAPNGRMDVLDAVEGMPCSGGGNIPESLVPALWSTATGKGLTWSRGSTPDADCPVGHKGMPCFRQHALPVILTAGNTVFHNAPDGSHRYGGQLSSAPTFAQATEALRAIGARVIPIDPTGGVTLQRDYKTLARDTNTVTADGEPITFTVPFDGSGLSETVVEAIAKLVSTLPFDVTTKLENVMGNPDDFDATQFVLSITPEKREQIVSGTEIEFELQLQNDVRPHQSEPQFFKARISLIGDGFVDLGSRIIYILVPPSGEPGNPGELQ